MNIEFIIAIYVVVAVISYGYFLAVLRHNFNGIATPGRDRLDALVFATFWPLSHVIAWGQLGGEYKLLCGFKWW